MPSRNACLVRATCTDMRSSELLIESWVTPPHSRHNASVDSSVNRARATAVTSTWLQRDSARDSSALLRLGSKDFTRLQFGNLARFPRVHRPACLEAGLEDAAFFLSQGFKHSRRVGIRRASRPIENTLVSDTRECTPKGFSQLIVFPNPRHFSSDGEIIFAQRSQVHVRVARIEPVACFGLH